VALLAADASTVAELLTAYVAIATAAGTAVWAVTRYLSDRRAARAQQERQAAEQLVQRQVEEVRARQQRAAELVKAVGDATDDRARRWTMSALSLYPDEALDLLLNSLGEASAEDAAAIKIAVISVGPDALPRAVRAHRIAGQISRTTETEGSLHGAASGQRLIDTATSGRVRDCTREIILQLVFQLDEDQRAAVDLAYVDLSRVSLAGARLSRISLRKTRLDHAILTRAFLNGAVLRGATVDGTVLRGARLRSADLTGASGAVQAIGVDLTGSTLDHAKLAGSNLNAAHLEGSSLAGTDLERSTLSGASLGGATLTRARLTRVVGRALKAPKLSAQQADFSHAAVEHADLHGGVFEDCVLVRLGGTGIKADSATFTGCNFGGARLDRASLAKARLRTCNLGGVDLSRADLSDAVVEECTISSARLIGATLAGVRFERCRFSGGVDFTGADLSTVTFAGCRFADGARLLADNDTWTGIADPVARAGFERAPA
jgi:uncharacterized protein YjbI with pentapeptide repeats